MIDMTSKPCEGCSKGVYKEVTIHNDWDGTLTCTNCGVTILRWQQEDE